MEWLEIQRSYFYDWFIPNVRANIKQGDALLIMGDVFDNRQMINILVQNVVIQLFKDLTTIFSEVHVLVGNHDIFRKETNEINSLKCLSIIPDITVYEEPVVKTYSGKKVVLMPWRKDHESEKETLEIYGGGDYLFCHSETYGVKLNKKVSYEKGNDIEVFKDYKRVYSGHIHYSQRVKNITYVGNPYEMTRSDTDNRKGIYIVDFENTKDIFIENTFSPKFLKMNIVDIYDSTLEEIQIRVKNNFVDLYLPSDLITKYDVSSLMGYFEETARKVDPNLYEGEVIINLESEENYSAFDVMNMTESYLKTRGLDDSIRKKVSEGIKELYKESLINEK
jgi:DNA repair exonuclease SbcCD nuclease subunit